MKHWLSYINQLRIQTQWYNRGGDCEIARRSVVFIVTKIAHIQ